ncbi:ATP-binding cassette domain-containing protein [Streptomyces sp. IB2014 016-6]|uniref:ABC transporter ATP-binding protein n=1 Tax=Streptomyces sp. IB2014 016-6 TaxID=2517818 RepID=UPI0011C71E57|nr:ATP-binding cassette domain-containing protein [Streptomyces sp. IB2014 016-6]TXL86671.1 ABC transporter ATP-binding protein [Streptomyces sp. IB2014 016-6]
MNEERAYGAERPPRPGTVHGPTRDPAHGVNHATRRDDPHPPPDVVLELDAVSVVFASGAGRRRRSLTAVNRVGFSIAAGETLGLVGESGSGKSTTGSVALGLLRPTSGTVRFLGSPHGGRRTRAGRIQAVLQNPHWSLNPRMTVLDCVAEPLTATEGGRLRTHHGQAARLLDQVGLPASYGDRLPHELSGGQRQRVAIARSLITRPRFIVFDEAVSALDVSVQAQTLNLIHDLQSQHGFGALFISHDLAAVRYLAHRIAVMREGSVVELADTARFYATPEHPYSRQLLETL